MPEVPRGFSYLPGEGLGVVDVGGAGWVGTRGLQRKFDRGWEGHVERMTASGKVALKVELGLNVELCEFCDCAIVVTTGVAGFALE